MVVTKQEAKQLDCVNADKKLSYGITHQRMAIIFNEWAANYAKNPEEFDNIIDDNGNNVNDYGDRCAIYFNRIGAELDKLGRLPKPNDPV